MAKTVKRKEVHRPWMTAEEDVERACSDYLKVSRAYDTIPLDAYEIAEGRAWNELEAALRRQRREEKSAK